MMEMVIRQTMGKVERKELEDIFIFLLHSRMGDVPNITERFKEFSREGQALLIGSMLHMVIETTTKKD